MCCRSIIRSSVDDVKNPRFWMAVAAEALGTLVLVIIGCGTCVGKDWEKLNPSNLQIAFAFGLTVATVVWCIGHLSGGHINPAVTAAMLLTRKISLVKAVLYVVAQSAGAVGGAALLKGLTPEDLLGDIGMTTVSDDITVVRAFGVEFFITFVLVLTVFASCDARRQDLKGSAPLTIGIAVLICHLFAVSATVQCRYYILFR